MINYSVEEKKYIYSQITGLLEHSEDLCAEAPSKARADLAERININCAKTIKALIDTGIPGIGSVVEALRTYMSIISEIGNTLYSVAMPNENQLKALGFITDRIKDKLWERLFPDDVEFVTKKMDAINQAFGVFKDNAVYILGEYEVLARLRNYRRIYVYEEDYESLLTYKYLDEIGIINLCGYAAVDDEFTIEGLDVLPIEKLSGGDCVLIIPTRYQLERYENSKIHEKCNCDIMRLDVFSERKYDYYISISDEMIKYELKMWYRKMTGRRLNLNNPVTYNEKIQWMKLYDCTPQKTRLADKYLVREFVAEKIGEKYLVPLLGVWDSYNDIDFDSLPDRFVLKCNHGSGMNKIVKSKAEIDHELFKKYFDYWMSINYAYYSGFEMHYRDIKPKIIAEEFLETETGKDIEDYKVMVFNGKAEYIVVDIDRFAEHKRNIYDVKWNNMQVSKAHPIETDRVLSRPDCLDELLHLAEKLGEGFAQARVDFYITGDGIKFGEITFTDGSGIESIQPQSFEVQLGKLIDLDLCSSSES